MLRARRFPNALRTIKAQAAMEFLMTYGWAVIIMLAVISVLYYSGVFNAPAMAPSSCVLPAGFTCAEFKLDEYGNLHLDLGQATGKAITVTGIGCSATGTPAITDNPAVQIRNGGHALVTGAGVQCANASGASFKGTLIVRYTSAGSALTRNAIGTLSAPYGGSGSGGSVAAGNLVLMLHLDNNPAVGDNATTAADVSGYGNNGTLASGMSYTTAGKHNGAMAFNQTGVLATTSSASLHMSNNSFSVSAWVYLSGTGNSGRPRIVSKRDDGVSNGKCYELDLFNDLSVRFEVVTNRSAGASTVLTPGVVLQNQTWYHLTGVRDRATGNVSLYINGQLVGTVVDSTDNTDADFSNVPLTIGGYLSSGSVSSPFNGTIDEVRVYTRALSVAEIQSLYQSGT